MFWSQPNPWANSIGWPSGRPETVTLCRLSTLTPQAIAVRPLSRRIRIRDRGGSPVTLLPDVPPTSLEESLMRVRPAVALLTTLALGTGAALATAPAAGAATGHRSLAAVLTSDGNKFDKNAGDFDITTQAVLTVLAAKPDSAVGARPRVASG